MTIFYDDGYCHENASFDTHLKARLVADGIAGLVGIDIVSPSPADRDDLASVHDETYVDAVATGEPTALATSNGFDWSPELFRGVSLSTGGARDAARTAYATGGVAGSLSSGLHHAGWSQGKGFCTFNGLALGALAARQDGASRVLIVDFDAHCGGGTADIIRRLDGIEQVDVSVSGFDHYTADDVARLAMADGSDYLDVIRATLDSVDDPGSIDLVLYNAGVDPHESAGGVHGITTDDLARRERMVFSWALSHGLAVAFVLAGGYAGHQFTLHDVAALHVDTVIAARDADG